MRLLQGNFNQESLARDLITRCRHRRDGCFFSSQQLTTFRWLVCFVEDRKVLARSLSDQPFRGHTEWTCKFVPQSALSVSIKLPTPHRFASRFFSPYLQPLLPHTFWSRLPPPPNITFPGFRGGGRGRSTLNKQNLRFDYDRDRTCGKSSFYLTVVSNAIFHTLTSSDCDSHTNLAVRRVC